MNKLTHLLTKNKNQRNNLLEKPRNSYKPQETETKGWNQVGNEAHTDRLLFNNTFIWDHSTKENQGIAIYSEGCRYSKDSHGQCNFQALLYDRLNAFYPSKLTVFII